VPGEDDSVEDLLRQGRIAEWLRREVLKRSARKAAETRARWRKMRGKPLGTFEDVDNPPDS
jgi:hypothetical protein